MSDRDLTDRLKIHASVVIEGERIMRPVLAHDLNVAADEIDRLRTTIAEQATALHDRAVEIMDQDATIAKGDLKMDDLYRAVQTRDATIAALLAIPDEHLADHDGEGAFDNIARRVSRAIKARMAAVVEGERGFHDAAPTEPEVGSRWLPKADLTAKPRTVTAVGWSIDKVWRVWWVGPDGKHGAAPELDLFLDGHVRMAAVPWWRGSRRD